MLWQYRLDWLLRTGSRFDAPSGWSWSTSSAATVELETHGMEAEYHLIDLATGLSHGGFQSLEAARLHAREEDLIAWDIFRGNLHVERHDPRADRIS